MLAGPQPRLASRTARAYIGATQLNVGVALGLASEGEVGAELREKIRDAAEFCRSESSTV